MENRQTRKIVCSTENFTKKDALNSRNGFSLQEMDSGSTIEIDKAAMLLAPDEEGAQKEVAVLITPDGEVYTSISSSVIDTVVDIIELIDTEGRQTLKLFKRNSKAGRQFLTLSVL